MFFFPVEVKADTDLFFYIKNYLKTVEQIFCLHLGKIFSNCKEINFSSMDCLGKIKM